MKQFLILIAMVCFAFSANAQGDTSIITSNVKATILDAYTDSVEVGYTLENANNYKVNVTAWVVYQDEKVSDEETYVIEANKSKPDDSTYLKMNHSAGNKPDFDKKHLNVNILVESSNE